MNDLRNNLPMLYDFYIVAKANSYSKAAEENFVSQSNLSRSVKNLEQTLGLELFVRNNKGISLTTDGDELYKRLDKMFVNISEYNVIDDKELAGTIVIGTTRNIADNMLSKFLTLFNKSYPNVKIKILIDSASNLNEYLIKHKIDVLIDYLPHINFSEKLDIEVKSIGQFSTCFACSETLYKQGAKNISTLSDFNDYKLVISGSSRRRQLLDEMLQLNDISLNPKVEMPDSKLMINFVKENDYIGYFIEDEIKETGLIKLEIAEKLPSNPIGIIYSKNTINVITENFVKLVLDNC